MLLLVVFEALAAGACEDVLLDVLGEVGDEVFAL